MAVSGAINNGLLLCFSISKACPQAVMSVKVKQAEIITLVIKVTL